MINIYRLNASKYLLFRKTIHVQMLSQAYTDQRNHSLLHANFSNPLVPVMVYCNTITHLMGPFCQIFVPCKHFLLCILEDIGGTPGRHIWDTWDTLELAPYLGHQLTFTAPTKCDPSAGHCSGHPPRPLHLLGDWTWAGKKLVIILIDCREYLVVYHGHVISFLIKTISLW